MFAPATLSELSFCRRGSYSRFVLAHAMMVLYWHIHPPCYLLEEVSIQGSFCK